MPVPRRPDHGHADRVGRGAASGRQGVARLAEHGPRVGTEHAGQRDGVQRRTGERPGGHGSPRRGMPTGPGPRGRAASRRSGTAADLRLGHAPHVTQRSSPDRQRRRRRRPGARAIGGSTTMGAASGWGANSRVKPSPSPGELRDGHPLPGPRRRCRDRRTAAVARCSRGTVSGSRSACRVRTTWKSGQARSTMICRLRLRPMQADLLELVAEHPAAPVRHHGHRALGPPVPEVHRPPDVQIAAAHGQVHAQAADAGGTPRGRRGPAGCRRGRRRWPPSRPRRTRHRPARRSAAAASRPARSPRRPGPPPSRLTTAALPTAACSPIRVTGVKARRAPSACRNGMLGTTDVSPSNSVGSPTSRPSGSASSCAVEMTRPVAACSGGVLDS